MTLKVLFDCGIKDFETSFMLEKKSEECFKTLRDGGS